MDCIFNSGEYRIVVYKNSHNIIIVLIKTKIIAAFSVIRYTIILKYFSSKLIKIWRIFFQIKRRRPTCPHLWFITPTG